MSLPSWEAREPRLSLPFSRPSFNASLSTFRPATEYEVFDFNPSLPNRFALHAQPVHAAPIVKGTMSAAARRFQENARSIMLFVINPGTMLMHPMTITPTARTSATATTPPTMSRTPWTSQEASGTSPLSSSSAAITMSIIMSPSIYVSTSSASARRPTHRKASCIVGGCNPNPI